MKFIIGLGNPGLNYKKTRHNAGFIALDIFVEQNLGLKSKWKNDKNLKAKTIELNFDDQNVLLIKPQTFMNNSGQIIPLLKKKYPQFDDKDLILIYDDIDLPLGKLRIKTDGSAGGHNGVKSLIQHLSTDNFKRVKIGVSNEIRDKVSAEKFVLQRFNRQEFKILTETLEPISDIINSIFNQDIEIVMNRFN